MSKQKKSSVLFSLKELMNLEEDRIKTEEDARTAKAAAEEAARREAEERARREEEARIRAEDERRRVEEARSREEAVRLDAIQKAEVEKARLEAEQRARMEALTAQQAHERSLVQLKEDKGKKSLRNTLIALGVIIPLAAGGIGFFLYKQNQETQARIRAQEADAREKEEALQKLKREIDENNTKMQTLRDQLAKAPTPEEKKKLEDELANLAKSNEEKGKKVGGGGGGAPKAGGGSGSGPKAACTCAAGDPLCSCF